jgi:hypothetical protein
MLLVQCSFYLLYLMSKEVLVQGGHPMVQPGQNHRRVHGGGRNNQNLKMLLDGMAAQE